MKVKVTLQNGQTLTVNFEGQKQEFLDTIRFDAGTAYLIDDKDTYFMVKNISTFKFEE